MLHTPLIVDPLRFEHACKKVLEQAQEANGIGTLNEKTVHAVLKHYYSPDEIYHEKKVAGYVADILIDDHIIEIQTRNFNTMRKKLDAFLPEHQVTIVYPIAATKWLCWINPETGEMSPKRKSPKPGTIHRIIPELYRIKNYLGHPHLRFILALIDIEEYRLLDGWSKDKKKGSTRKDGIPVGLVDEVRFDTLGDFAKLLPADLPEHFTTKDYKKLAKVTDRVAGTCLNVLYALDVIERIGKKGNAYIYERTNKNAQADIS